MCARSARPRLQQVYNMYISRKYKRRILKNIIILFTEFILYYVRRPKRGIISYIYIYNIMYTQRRQLLESRRPARRWLSASRSFSVA